MRRSRRANSSIFSLILNHPACNQCCILSFLSVGFLFIIWALVIYDPCGGKIVTRNLCKQYEAGLIAGELCYQLCNDQTISLRSCQRPNYGLNIFTFQSLLLKVPVMMSYEDEAEIVSDFPTDGITVEQFQSRVATFLSAKLGLTDNQELIESLLNFADFNHNQQISLDEARSLWSLLQIHEFLMMFVFRQTRDYFPQLNGTCGSLYAANRVPRTYLYEKSDTYFQRIFPSSYLWTLPKWKYRAKVAVGLLDFIFTVYEYEGVFYNLCHVTPQNLGYSNKYDFHVLDLNSVHADKWLKLKFRNVSCSSDEDCVHTPHCSTICDQLTWECSSRLKRPNLSVTCEILQEYILPDAPSSISSKLEELLLECVTLDNHKPDSELQHMLVLNQLLSLMFNQIKWEADVLLR